MLIYVIVYCKMDFKKPWIVHARDHTVHGCIFPRFFSEFVTETVPCMVRHAVGQSAECFAKWKKSSHAADYYACRLCSKLVYSSSLSMSVTSSILLMSRSPVVSSSLLKSGSRPPDSRDRFRRRTPVGGVDSTHRRTSGLLQWTLETAV